MHQIEMVSLNDLVSSSHIYRKFAAIYSFAQVENRLKKLEKDNPYKGFGMLRLFKCLLLQFIEDLSDRELMRFLEENMLAKWFVGFGLAEITPEHTVFCKFRKRLGTKFLSEVFRDLREQLKRQGLMDEVFSFVDASHLIAKASLWEE
ncbi:MAG: transposase [Gammaproteobacteria bacterium]